MRTFGLVLLSALTSSPSVHGQVVLPTPREHYQNFDVEAYGRALLLELMATVPESTRERALALFSKSNGDSSVEVDVAQAREILEAADWQSWRSRMLPVLLHGSRVLEVIPKEASDWLPLVHDGFLFFLDRLSDERLIERIVEQVNLPRDAARGERVLALIVNAPSLQKLAQILARNPALDPDIRAALQRMENSVSSIRYEQVMEEIERELDPDVVREYRIQFADDLLAEASVGAVVEASFVAPGNQTSERAACKVLKPRAVLALAEDLAIIDDMLAYLEEHGSFYGIGSAPLVDIFEEIREALSREVRVNDERENLVRAGEYYRDVPAILVPEVFPFSTPNVTCMEFVEGVKITDAFPGKPEDRRRLARRLSDALTYEVLFSQKEPALFHGDPHAGNVFHVQGDANDPYRIALLDWGLAADFNREEREKLVQLMVGLYLRDVKRLSNNVGVLVDLGEASPDEKVRELVEKVIAGPTGDGMFALLDDLVTALAREGYSVRFEPAIFIKSQLTIGGILTELDPEFEQDRYLRERISGQVYRELHTRLLRTLWFPAWNSHEYRSLMSNEDVKDVQVKRIGGAFKMAGKGIWVAISFQWLF